MILEFTKMNGAGNDFVVIDNRDRKIRLTTEQIARLCHRHRGVGADGLMMLVPSSGKADWAWDFYNADGGPADMCGNGSRCFARYIQRTTGTTKEVITFETGAGIITARFLGERVDINLTSPHSLRVNEAISLSTGPGTIHSFNTGVPHAVFFVADADKTMVGPLGSEIRYHQHFAPKGTNANFVQILGPNHIRVRTYERGVENETLACGTGVSACAMVTAKVHNFTSPVKIQVQGGDQMEVTFERKGDEFSNVHLIGPAEFVYTGKIEV